MGSELTQAIVDMMFNEIEDLVQRALDSGRPPMEILEELRVGLEIVGEKFERKEYFLSDLYMAAETMRRALEVLKPHLKGKKGKFRGKIVIGSIIGDIHDFGKNIVISLLLSQGFEVYDLGIDVEPARFVTEALRVGADVIGVSALLSATQPRVKELIDELEARGVRDRFKVILGGAGVQEDAVERWGVDAAVNDGVKGVEIIKSWLGVKKGDDE